MFPVPSFVFYSTHIKTVFSTMRERKWLKSAEASSLAVIITRIVSTPLSWVQQPSSRSVQPVFGRPLVQHPAGSLWLFLISLCNAYTMFSPVAMHGCSWTANHLRYMAYNRWHCVWWHLMSVMLLVDSSLSFVMTTFYDLSQTSGTVFSCCWCVVKLCWNWISKLGAKNLCICIRYFPQPSIHV